jgi:hypothetical protein
MICLHPVKIMNSFIKNIYHRNSKSIRKVIVYLTINSILFFGFINVQQLSTTELSDKQNESFISIPIQNILEQTNNQRNFRHNSHEKFSINDLFATFLSQENIFRNSQQRLSLTVIFGNVFTSQNNNHSLRSPPQIL